MFLNDVFNYEANMHPSHDPVEIQYTVIPRLTSDPANEFFD